MFDDDGAAVCYLRLLEIDPSNSVASAAIAESENKRQRFSRAGLDLRHRGRTGASDEVYKSSMLMRAAEMEVRFGGQSVSFETAIERLEQAVRLDPTNERAGRLLEHIYRSGNRWEELARVLERLADRSEKPASRVAAGVRLARLYAQHLSDNERAARAYDRVLRVDASHAEAKGFLSEFYGNDERWADLGGAVRARAQGQRHERRRAPRRHAADRDAALAQARASRKTPSRGSSAFARSKPTNEGMLNFYREYYGSLRRRHAPDRRAAGRAARGAGRLERAQEARVRDRQAGRRHGQRAKGDRAVQEHPASGSGQQSKRVMRSKRLYKQTQGYNALVELLRQQLERTPAEAVPGAARDLARGRDRVSAVRAQPADGQRLSIEGNTVIIIQFVCSTRI